MEIFAKCFVQALPLSFSAPAQVLFSPKFVIALVSTTHTSGLDDELFPSRIRSRLPLVLSTSSPVNKAYQGRNRTAPKSYHRRYTMPQGQDSIKKSTRIELELYFYLKENHMYSASKDVSIFSCSYG